MTDNNGLADSLPASQQHGKRGEPFTPAQPLTASDFLSAALQRQVEKMAKVTIAPYTPRHHKVVSDGKGGIKVVEVSDD
jgi:hypothetical protein